MHHLKPRWRAHALYKREVEYIVRAAKSSSSMNSPDAPCPAGAESDGLHQAVEARRRAGARGEPDDAGVTFLK